jgi:DNA (cytosine-5)-methyltransferase 1
LSTGAADVILMENVYGLAYRNQNRAIFDRFQARIRAAGYTFNHRVLLAADYGVPQLRQRLVCVGVRADLLDCDEAAWEFAWPTARFSGPHETRTGWTRRSRVTAPPAGRCETCRPTSTPRRPEEHVHGTYADELRGVPPATTTSGGPPARPPRASLRVALALLSFLLKLHQDRPAPTIQGQPGRGSTVPLGEPATSGRRAEAADDVPRRLRRRRHQTEQQLQLGNAVPPLLAAEVGTALRVELERLGAVDSPVTIAA